MHLCRFLFEEPAVRAAGHRSGCGVVRLFVTPIGASGSTPGGVARAVVDYLEGGAADPASSLLLGSSQAGQPVVDAVGYFADSTEGPGRWLGRGAEALGLTGTVTRDALSSVLTGRDSTTGARLLTAQGSTRRGHLAVGAGERRSGDCWVYAIADAAKLLGVTKTDVATWIQEADRRPGTGDPDAFGWINALTDDTGIRLITGHEIARVERLLTSRTEPERIAAGGADDDLLTVDEAARALNVSARYVRRVCATHERQQASPGVGGRTPREQSLPCRRGAARGAFEIRRADLAAFAASRTPPIARVGFDVTLTVEKSIGILTLLTTGPEHDVFVRALRVANQTALDHLDRHAALTRVRRNTVPTTGLVAAAYTHATSRTLDPHPHVHNIVANTVTTLDGEHRTLDARALYRFAPAAAALATAGARWELRTLGIGWRQRDDGIWEIDGVSDSAIEEFSRRHHDIDDIKTALAERLQLPPGTLDTTAWATTRADKHAVNVGDLLAGWHQRAGTCGLDRNGITACFGRAAPALAFDRLPDDLTACLHADLIGERGVTVEDSIFTRSTVLRAITDWSIPARPAGRRKVLLPPDEVERLADDFLASDHVLRLAPNARTGRTIAGIDDPVYSTVDILQLQADILDRYDASHHTGHAIVAPSVLVATLAGFPDLTDEQRNLVLVWCTSGDAIGTAVGRAGTGKTTTMRAVVAAYQQAGLRVVGTTVKGEAARQLAHDARIEADTLALLLTQARRGERPLDARTVVIVDEASTVGDRDLHELLAHAAAAGATIRLIGDPAQHSAVPAGGSYRALLNHDPTRVPQLTHVFRLQNPAERTSAELVRTGRIADALDHLRTTGQLVTEPTEAATYAAVLERWWQARQNGQAHPMVHQRNTVRQLLNRLAQQLLEADGSIAPVGAARLRDGRRLCVGDEVIARGGNRRLHPQQRPEHWVRNGTRGVIVGIRHEDDDVAITMATEHGEIDVPRSYFDRTRGGLDLAYAVTSYAVQGATQPASTSILTTASTRPELYVDITRGRSTNQVYATDTTADRQDEPHLPRLTGDIDKQIERALDRSVQRTALSADADALQRLSRNRSASPSPTP